MAQQSFLSEILARVAGAGRSRTEAPADVSDRLISLCHSLIHDRSEAAGLMISRQILDLYAASKSDERAAFFLAVSQEFGPDEDALMHVQSTSQISACREGLPVVPGV